MFTTLRPLVLVVDDDERSARLLAQLLRGDGFDAEVAFDGAAALGRLLRAPVPTALVTDLRMPHADGATLARFARSHLPSLPLFIVTAYPNLVRQQGLEPVRIFTKPLDYAQLTSALAASA